jgi:hypothetical protein
LWDLLRDRRRLLELISMSFPGPHHRRQLRPSVLCCGCRRTDAPGSRRMAAGADEA